MTNEIEITDISLEDLKITDTPSKLIGLALLKAFEMGQEAGRKNRSLVGTTKFNDAVQCANTSDAFIRKEGFLRNMFIYGYMAEIKT